MSITTGDAAAPQYITSAQLGATFEPPIQRETLEHWRRVGKGPQFVRINGRIYYEVSAVKAWIAANTHSSTASYDPPQSHSAARAAARANELREARRQAQPA